MGDSLASNSQAADVVCLVVWDDMCGGLPLHNGMCVWLAVILLAHVSASASTFYNSMGVITHAVGCLWLCGGVGSRFIFNIMRNINDISFFWCVCVMRLVVGVFV